MLSLLKLGSSEYAQKTHFRSINLNNSEGLGLSFEDIFLGTVDTYTKHQPTLGIYGGGGEGGGCTVGFVSSKRKWVISKP